MILFVSLEEAIPKINSLRKKHWTPFREDGHFHQRIVGHEQSFPAGRWLRMLNRWEQRYLVLPTKADFSHIHFHQQRLRNLSHECFHWPCLWEHRENTSQLLIAPHLICVEVGFSSCRSRFSLELMSRLNVVSPFSDAFSLPTLRFPFLRSARKKVSVRSLNFPSHIWPTALKGDLQRRSSKKDDGSLCMIICKNYQKWRSVYYLTFKRQNSPKHLLAPWISKSWNSLWR